MADHRDVHAFAALRRGIGLATAVGVMSRILLAIVLLQITACTTVQLYAPDARQLSGALVSEDAASGTYIVQIANHYNRPAQYFHRSLLKDATPVFYYTVKSAEGIETRLCVGCGDDFIHDTSLPPGGTVSIALHAKGENVTSIGIPFLNARGQQYWVWVKVAAT